VQGDEVVVEFLIVDPDQLDKEAAEAEKFATAKRQLAEWDGNHQDPTEEELVERQRLMYLSTPKTYGDIETAVQALQEWDAAHKDSDLTDEELVERQELEDRATYNTDAKYTFTEGSSLHLTLNPLNMTLSTLVLAVRRRKNMAGREPRAMYGALFNNTTGPQNWGSRATRSRLPLVDDEAVKSWRIMSQKQDRYCVSVILYRQGDRANTPTLQGDPYIVPSEHIEIVGDEPCML
jgi:hypothetical protein